ncbi:Extracellular membrane protein, CFEM domain protein [Cordyceps fumosorosea ARSEF 2679]|uniref:Extracellular membrane protein, CFEM domain protein n=1 Tax=Cordyceps fumosorosea (strain ARSEF 2679) TaxID=1081104 RepID=A0A162ICE4_CORFA|nr:Extracellular membrane protein, CFEM domain protein [Cordyceps fumosorosea ARSEF 2679]OAA55115.1 Extracellular membrane protein, CFEM domain protein [Cordyceps fumosorosea ARSEF 2679]
MKAAVVLVSVVGLVAAIITPPWVPGCSRPCLGKPIDNSGCRTTDMRCLCQDFVIDKIVNQAWPCIAGKCGIFDQVQVHRKLRFHFCRWPNMVEPPGERPPPTNVKQPPKRPKPVPLPWKIRQKPSKTQSTPIPTPTPSAGGRGVDDEAALDAGSDEVAVDGGELDNVAPDA